MQLWKRAGNSLLTAILCFAAAVAWVRLSLPRWEVPAVLIVFGGLAILLWNAWRPRADG